MYNKEVHEKEDNIQVEFKVLIKLWFKKWFRLITKDFVVSEVAISSYSRDNQV